MSLNGPGIRLSTGNFGQFTNGVALVPQLGTFLDDEIFGILLSYGETRL